MVFGVKSKGEILGQQITEKTLRDISKAVSDHIEPKIYPEIKKEEIEGKPCISIRFSGNDLPYFAYGKAYMRVSDEDKQLSAKELKKLVLKESKEELRWDTETCKKAKINDISTGKLKRFLKKTGKRFDNLNNSLKKLNLLKNNKPTNAAVILLAKKPQEFFPNARARCAVFGTTDTSVTIDMQDFEGDLFYLIDKAEKYFLENIHIGMRVEGLRRIDIPEINKKAFREAIINAFCHRDYWKFDPVNIAIFKDRVEIRSPGLLYGNLTIEKIKQENISERRNELLAKSFHEVHYVENWGRGISSILSAEPDAEFKELGTHFITVFRRKGVEKLSETEQIILKMIEQNPKISKQAMQKESRAGKKAIEYNIEQLKKKGILWRVGPAKGGHWEIIEK